MPLTPGTRVGPYEVAVKIGEGGMGEVYRATDTSLKRSVALKVLPESVAADPDRLARFQREAEVLAALNHPHIAQIHGLERADGLTALVMELVEGPTLADRIAAGPVPVDEALPIARQIAEALEAAHEQGIIHRDLKPANIKVRDDGTVKVLDFGLAKALEPASALRSAAGQAVAMSPSLLPTLTTPAMTQAGMILGTAAYMSPEQAKGRPADRRSDIWSFGCVLYEMLAGRRLFGGDDVSEVFADVIKGQASFDALPAGVPDSVRRLLRKCLQKDRSNRLDSAAAVRLELDETKSREFTGGPAQAPASARSALGRIAGIGVVALVAGAALAGAGVWYAMRSAPAQLVRLEIATAGATALSLQGLDTDVAITADGSRIVYRGNNQWLVRALDQLAPTALPAMGATRAATVSPDGQWVAFFDGSTLKKVPITGGSPITVAQGVRGGGLRGASWGEDGNIVFSSPDGLRHVSAGGGVPTSLTTTDSDREVGHAWPEVLPGGRAVLFTSVQTGSSLDDAQVLLLDLRTNTQKVLVRGGYHAHYMPSGHLVYGSGGALRAVPFDLSSLEVSGTAVTVLENVLTSSVGALNLAVARNGTLVYVPGNVVSTRRTLVWVDRTGRQESIPAPPRAYVYAQLSPDGTKVAVDIRDQDQDVWIWDLTRETLQRLTFDRGLNRGPLWAPDGRRVAFSRVGDGGGEEVYWQAADGSGVPEALTEKSIRSMVPSGFTPDGRSLLYQPNLQPRDVWISGVARPPVSGMTLLNGPADEQNAVVSPDGRWLAYQSNESGANEIYVRPFPDVGAGRWQISRSGGTRPLWSADGRELFFYVGAARRGALMAVAVESTRAFVPGVPKMLFEGNYPAPNAGRGLYDVSRDGRRFLMIKGEDGGPAPQNLTVVLNWDQELKRLVPVN